MSRTVVQLTCIGDSKAVGRLYVVHMRHQVEGSLRRIRAGVVKEDGKSKGCIFLICIPYEQAAWREVRGKERGQEGGGRRGGGQKNGVRRKGERERKGKK